MSEFFDTIVSTINDVFTNIQWVFDSIGQTIRNIVTLLSAQVKLVGIINQFYAYMPSIISVVVTIVISILVIKFLLNLLPI